MLQCNGNYLENVLILKFLHAFKHTFVLSMCLIHGRPAAPTRGAEFSQKPRASIRLRPHDTSRFAPPPPALPLLT